MNYIDTDGNNKDFVILCGMLDDYLFKIVGGEKQRKQYAQYNGLEDIHDVILLYDEDIPVACAGFKYYTGGTAEIKRVFMKEEYRGKGLSKELLRRLEEKAKERGYEKLILETGKHLLQAISLYTKLGYEITENYGQYKNMKESVCMSKSL
jgi:GNAT superfamily N-acetyltransferase